ncbi:YqaJ viral recombinase family protein [Polynucleobacter sp. MWH-UH19D]|uniref:YqaJ viral recombinase family nuclease n=1 Tax=Polynucleobacter sp. MWH-UH19D TaxID=1855610 RepID=UPI0033650F8E
MLINQDFSPDRTKYIGGSDIGAILGLSRFRSPLEVWMEKTGKEARQLDSLPLRFGSFAEEFVASEYARATGFELLHDESIHIHPEHSYMCAHVDRFVLEGGSTPSRILECKTANPFTLFTSSEWGEVGSDEVPMSYLCQCIWYMAITNIDRVDLAVLFGNSDFRIYEITRDQELERMVIQKATTFWQEHVLKDIPPPAISESDCHALFGKGDPGKSIEAKTGTLELTNRLQLLNSEIEVREEEISSIKQNIMNQMQEAETLTHQGKVLATWKAPKPSFRLDSKRLELDHPEITSNYKVQVQNSRRLVIKSFNS